MKRHIRPARWAYRLNREPISYRDLVAAWHSLRMPSKARPQGRAFYATPEGPMTSSSAAATRSRPIEIRTLTELVNRARRPKGEF